MKVQNLAQVYEPAVVEDGVFIGPPRSSPTTSTPGHPPDGSRVEASDWQPVGVTLRQGCSVGARAVCVAPSRSAGGRWWPRAVVVHDVPDFALVAGTPARRIGWVGPAGRRLLDEGEGRWRARSRARCSPSPGGTCASLVTMTEHAAPRVSAVRVHVGDEETAAVMQVLRSGRLVQGQEVAAFEDEFAAIVGGHTCVAVNSGTSALHLGLLAAGIGPGDEVVVPSFTFAATANAVAMTGATPVFADIEPDTFCLDPDAVAAAVTARTAAVLPVHLYGHPAGGTGWPASPNGTACSSSRTPRRPTGRRTTGSRWAPSGTSRRSASTPPRT